MKLLILLFLNIVSGFRFRYRPIFKSKFKSMVKLHSNICLNILPSKTVAFYKLNNDQANEISKLIDKNYKLEPLYLNTNISYYLGLTFYKYNTTTNNNLTYACKLFVNVINIHTRLCGEYILESTEYKNGLYIDQYSIICSFYGNNLNYYCHISYLHDNLDISYYNNCNYYNYIVDDNILYINTDNDTILNNIARYPEYTYISQLKYKNMYWHEAELILYYKKGYNYIIDEKV